VDKLNHDYVTNYLDGYLKMYADTVGNGKIGKDGISFLLTDSIEVGPQNWTDKMLESFKRGEVTMPRPWLPALTGVVIKSLKIRPVSLGFSPHHRSTHRGKSLRRYFRPTYTSMG